MTPHDHRTYVEGCFRCELSRDEASNPRYDSMLLSDDAQTWWWPRSSRGPLLTPTGAAIRIVQWHKHYGTDNADHVDRTINLTPTVTAVWMREVHDGIGWDRVECPFDDLAAEPYWRVELERSRERALGEGT